MKRGLIVPLPKPGKDPTYKDQNRGITLVPVIYKVFENILIDREKEWFEELNVIDDIYTVIQLKAEAKLHTNKNGK